MKDSTLPVPINGKSDITLKKYSTIATSSKEGDAIIIPIPIEVTTSPTHQTLLFHHQTLVMENGDTLVIEGWGTDIVVGKLIIPIK